jgi:two-component system copper resistance phosphate regulon response regulator CusR
MRILVVEDEEPIADFLVRGLAEEGFTVEHASDGEAGWKALQAKTWDLVLLDWWLPVMDGYTLLERFRQAGNNTPVLFLTARDAVSDRVKGLDGGADDYICKPFVFEELLARIRALLRRCEPAQETRLTYEDIVMDLMSQVTRRGGHDLELTRTEHNLLAYFLRHPNEVHSRAEIYETVWNEPFGAFSNTVDAHIKELRRKLENHGPRLIHTARGRGYLFGDPAAAVPESRE